MLDEMDLRPEKIPRADPRITLGADKLYQERKFIEGLRQRRVVPHVAEYEPSAHGPNFLTEAERNDPGFAISQTKRKLVERVFERSDACFFGQNGQQFWGSRANTQSGSILRDLGCR